LLVKSGREIYFEDEEPEKYPVYLGYWERIRYWMNDSSSKQGKHVLKKKKQKEIRRINGFL